MPDIPPAGGAITPVRPDVTADFRSDRNAGHNTGSGERAQLAEHLEEMAATLEPVDSRAADRMRGLARAVATDEGRQRWAEVDLRRVFNTERLAYALALEREGGYAHSTIAGADRLRNILVLVPILLTWFALAEAARAYDRYLALSPDEVRQPFLLLWERGFGGQASAFAPSFSTVALIDAFLIAIIIGLTLYSHGRREAREEKIDQTAEHFQSDIDNVLAEASVVLAVDRGSRPALLARGVERLVDRFEQNSQELLTRLRVEHDRLEQLAGRREREFADFGVFASGMRAGAEETHRLLVELRQVSTGLQAALEDLTSEVSSSVDQGRTLLKAVQGLEQLTVANLQSDQTLTRQIAAAAEALVEAAAKGIAGADSAAQASRVATEAVRGIAASARDLGEIEGELSGLRDEMGRLASGTAGQAQTLSSLLEEQASIATGLSQGARDISTISMRTAQRQEEVSRDVGTLIERLERVIQSLGRGAGIDVEDPAPPGRLDPERLWPRRRS